MFICDNCLQEYKKKSTLEKHITNKKKKCNKVILNSDGTIQNKQPNQCDYCYAVLSTPYVYAEHIKTCNKYFAKKKNEQKQLKTQNQQLLKENNELKREFEQANVFLKKEIDDIKTQLAQKDKQLATININNNVVNNNVQIINYNYNILAFYTIKPPTEFKEVEDNFINIHKISFLNPFGRSKKNEKDENDKIDNDICNVIINRFADDSTLNETDDVLKRNMWSDNVNSNIHCYIDSCWFLYNEEEKFLNKVIIPTIRQIIKTLEEILDICYAFVNIDIIKLKKYKDLFENKNIFEVLTFIPTEVNLLLEEYNRFKRQYFGLSPKEEISINNDATSMVVNNMKEDEGFKKYCKNTSINSQIEFINMNCIKQYTKKLERLKEKDYHLSILEKIKDHAKYNPALHESSIINDLKSRNDIQKINLIEKKEPIDNLKNRYDIQKIIRNE